MSATVCCGGLLTGDGLITRWSLVQVQFATLFSVLEFMISKVKKIFIILYALPNPIVDTEEDRCNYVITKYIFAFFMVVGSILTSYMMADLINELVPLTLIKIKIMEIISVSILTVGAWGSLRWPAQTTKIKSHAEDFDDYISRIFSFCGFLMTLVSYQLVPNDL